MPDIIQRAFADSPTILQWYSWGVIAGFLIALAATVWVFVDAQRSGQDAIVWKTIVAIATVLSVPALLARVSTAFAFEMRDSLLLVANLSMLAVVLALGSAAAYAAMRGRGSARCPVCGQPLQAGWAQCPYHPSPPPAKPLVADPTPIADAVPPIGYGPPPAATMMGAVPGVAPVVEPVRGQTVILSRAKGPRALAFLAIVSGPYAGTVLPLGDDVTRLGRDADNDHVVDDDAVSGNHVSIRHQEGSFVLTDLDSSNHTYVNGDQVDKHTLTSGDRVKIGKTKMVFLQVQESAIEVPI